MKNFRGKIILVLLAAVFLMSGSASAQEVQIVTKSFKVMQGELVELTKEYVKVKTEDGVFRVRLNQLNDASYDMLYDLPQEIKAKLAPKPPDKEAKPIDFAAINYTDWDVASKKYLQDTSTALTFQAGMLSHPVFTSMALRKSRPWGKIPVALETSLLDLRAQTEVDIKPFEEVVPPPRLKKYHELILENYKKSVELYSLALSDKYDKTDSMGYAIMENARAALVELKKAYEAVYAPSVYVDQMNGRIESQDKVLKLYEDVAE